MSYSRRTKILVGLAFGFLSSIVSWLVNTESSPFYHYFLFHPALPNFWAALNIVPYGIVLVIFGIHNNFGLELIIGYTALFVFWFMIGFGLATLFGIVFGGRRPT